MWKTTVMFLTVSEYGDGVTFIDWCYSSSVRFIYYALINFFIREIEVMGRIFVLNLYDVSNVVTFVMVKFEFITVIHTLQCFISKLPCYFVGFRLNRPLVFACW